MPACDALSAFPRQVRRGMPIYWMLKDCVFRLLSAFRIWFSVSNGQITWISFACCINVRTFRTFWAKFET